MNLKLLGTLVGALLLVAHPAVASPVTPQGQQLAARLDALDVEERWPAGEHVDWRTGIPDGRPERTEGKHTHCSAFVASAAQQLGIYILRPPDHSQVLLANAQYDWLSEAGAAQGWQSVEDGATAQADSNRGDLVVAVYRNHHDDRPGHIAIIRPDDKDPALLETEGPQITQAGGTNYRSASLREGFAGHPAAWGKGEVRYYRHAVDWARLAR